jgi:hypothetical protein
MEEGEHMPFLPFTLKERQIVGVVAMNSCINADEFSELE